VEVRAEGRAGSEDGGADGAVRTVCSGIGWPCFKQRLQLSPRPTSPCTAGEQVQHPTATQLPQVSAVTCFIGKACPHVLSYVDYR
jgi:hypothetical protein